MIGSSARLGSDIDAGVKNRGACGANSQGKKQNQG
jgi:hypothetical protein